MNTQDKSAKSMVQGVLISCHTILLENRLVWVLVRRAKMWLYSTCEQRSSQRRFACDCKMTLGLHIKGFFSATDIFEICDAELSSMIDSVRTM